MRNRIWQSNRIWQYGLIWSCLALAACPSWAQFGGGAGMGISMAGERGLPTSIDLLDATLGQIVDVLMEKNSVSSEENGAPVNILISDKLRDLKIGTIKLSELRPHTALQAISKLTDESFVIEVVADGQVLVLRPANNQVVVKAITLNWMAISQAVTKGFIQSIEELPTDEANKEEVKRTQDTIKQREKELNDSIAAMTQTIDEAFTMHAKVSGHRLSPPMISIQQELHMVMVVGSPESVEIATEIINATNSSQNAVGFGGGAGGGFF